MNQKNAFYQANCTQGPIKAGNAGRVIQMWLSRLLWGPKNMAVVDTHHPTRLTGGDPRTIADMKP